MRGRIEIAGVLPIVDVAPGGLVAPDRAGDVTRALLLGGARMLQLRAKSAAARDLLTLARAMRALTEEAGARLIINDRPDVAVLANADGVHLGQEDLPAREVRRWLPAPQAIGISCHTLEQVATAVREGASDYIGYGPIYDTRSKENPNATVGLEGLRSVCEAHPKLKVVAIGGITLDRLGDVRRAGAHAAAMISGLLSARDLTERMREAARIWGRLSS